MSKHGKHRHGQPMGGLRTSVRGSVPVPPSVASAPRNWYDATRDSKRRRTPSMLLMSEDRILLPFSRRRMVGTARDLRRNFSIAAWAIRMHLNFVSMFTFHARAASDEVNALLERMVGVWSQPYRFDCAGRHGRQQYMRLLEACAVVDGDCGNVPISNGTLQAIEGDRIRTPWDAEGLDEGDKHFVHGVQVNGSGRAIQYAVCKRSVLGTSMELDRMVPARYMWMHGYYDRFDQVRGITPLASALNEFQDLYEARVYALAKAKIAQLFGMKFTRAASDTLDTNLTGAAQPAADATGAPPEDYPSIVKAAYDHDGVPMLDMDPGEDASFLENRTPSTEFQQFDERIIQSALKSLDLPLWFYDEARTNFFGSKGALQQYLFGCQIKRDNLRAIHNRWTAWRIGMAIATGELELPDGLTYPDLSWEWVPAGLPWWQPLEEVRAQEAAIRGGLMSTPAACKDRGEDAYRLIDEEARYRIYRAQKAKEVHAAGGVMPEELPTQVSETIRSQEEQALEGEKIESARQAAAKGGTGSKK